MSVKSPISPSPPPNRRTEAPVSSSHAEVPSLEKSQNFQEMLVALEYYDQIVSQGEIAGKYDAGFYGSLRTMMRDCLFSKDEQMRIEHIQRLYEWFAEKRTRSPIFQKMEQTKPKGGNTPVGGTPGSINSNAATPLPTAGISSKKPLQPRPPESLKSHLDRQLKKPLPFVPKKTVVDGLRVSTSTLDVQQANETSSPITASPMRPPSSGNNNNTGYYLGSSSPLPPPSSTTAFPSVGSPLLRGGSKLPFEVQQQQQQHQMLMMLMQQQQQQQQQQHGIPGQPQQGGKAKELDLSNYKLRNLAESHARRTGMILPTDPSKSDVENVANKEVAAAAPDGSEQSFVHYRMIHPTELAMQELWLQKRKEDENEKKNQKEITDAMEWWSTHRARIEEEISRRQEANRFSSQTGTLYASRPSTAASRSSKGGGRNGGRKPSNYAFSDSDMSSESESDVEVYEDVDDGKGNSDIPENFNVRTPMRSRPQSARPSSSRPMSAVIRRPDPEDNTGLSPYKLHLERGESGDESGDAGVQSSSRKILYGFKSPHEGHDASDDARGFPRRPMSAYSASTLTSRSVTGGQYNSSAAPSRITQMGEIDRIKISFAQQHIVCPLQTIEKGVLVPEDKSYALCLQGLPHPAAHLREDPFAKEKKGKKGKKGKGGKKKGGKKKGGKKKKK